MAYVCEVRGKGQESELWRALTPLLMEQWEKQKDISRWCAIFVGKRTDYVKFQSPCVLWYN